ncbi:chromosome partitioning protein [Rhizobiales bacterium GAS191]|nr:chromosome partitioning protein [Rhizobiales bacterium GAS113]SEE84331.1 chromosome partitioning protein [Rhizobiales bacterium GAS191]
MRTIALVTQKGGSGKSTLSASLAVAAQAARERVFLIDMDPQRSLTTWAENRSDENLGVEAIAPGKLPAVLETLVAGHVSLAIIDTPASLTAASEAAMRAADLIIIPVRPTVFDIWASEATRRRARELQKECVFVLNQCPIVQGSRRFQEGVNALEAMGGILQPMITARVDYQEAIRCGLGPTEINPTGDAAEEMRQLFMSVRRRLARVKVGLQAGQRAA